MEKQAIRALKTKTNPEKNFVEEQQEVTVEALRKATTAIVGENVPTVKVADNDLIKVEFLSEPQVKHTKYGTDVAYAIVKMLAPHTGFKREQNAEDVEVDLKVGDKAGLNLYRHTTLRLQAERYAPLTGKKFIIGRVGELPSKKGKPAKDYRWMPLAD